MGANLRYTLFARMMPFHRGQSGRLLGHTGVHKCFVIRVNRHVHVKPVGLTTQWQEVVNLELRRGGVIRAGRRLDDRHAKHRQVSSYCGLQMRAQHSEDGSSHFPCFVTGCSCFGDMASTGRTHKRTQHSEDGSSQFPCVITGCSCFGDMASTGRTHKRTHIQRMGAITPFHGPSVQW